ncbi:MAG: N-acetyltransferase family protein [Nanoarchaeota archaeon]
MTTIRNARLADLPHIMDLFFMMQEHNDAEMHASFQEFRTRSPDFHEQARRYIFESMQDKNGCFLVAETKNGISGFVYGFTHLPRPRLYTLPPTGTLRYLAVHTKAQNMGVGSALYKEIEKWFAQEGCRYIQLETLHGSTAEKIYKKWGFASVMAKMKKRLED